LKNGGLEADYLHTFIYNNCASAQTGQRKCEKAIVHIEPPLGEKSDKDAAEKGEKCNTEKDSGYYLESRNVSHYNCYDSHLTDLKLTHSNPTHVGNFPFSLNALFGCHLEIKIIYISSHFLQKPIAKVLEKSIDVILWVLSVACS
jgi:hypothetical protein